MTERSDLLVHRSDDEREDWLEDARREEYEDRHGDPDERHGFNVCRTGACDEPCGMDGGCSR